MNENKFAILRDQAIALQMQLGVMIQMLEEAILGREGSGARSTEKVSRSAEDRVPRFFNSEGQPGSEAPPVLEPDDLRARMERAEPSRRT